MGGRFVDLTGQRFNRLTVIKRAPNKIESSGNQKSAWLCKCDCGNEIIVIGTNLRRGNTKSCGCLWLEAIRKSNSTHQDTGTRLHNEWRAIKARCYIPSCSNYEYYGGRGIKVCKEWLHNYTAFKEWAIENGYNDQLSIDRIDPDGNYEPDNCRWVSMQKQFWNRRIRKSNKSGISGVTWRKDSKKWRANITVNRKAINLGCFEDKEDAVRARKQAEEKYWAC